MLIAMWIVFIWMSWALNRFNAQEVKASLIEVLYKQKAWLIEQRRDILIKKQAIDSQLSGMKEKLNEVDEKLKQEVNSWLDFQPLQ